MSQHDVIIIGAGMVGAVSALLLAEQGHRVAVIESQQPVQVPQSGSRTLRVSAIANNNLQLFQQLGIYDLIGEQHMGFYQHMNVWDNQSTGALNFNSPGPDPLGAMVENERIMAAAQQCLQQHPQIEVHYQQKLAQMEQTERQVKITLSDGEKRQAGLLVGADGARSAVREMAGIGIDRKDYHQQGLVCYIRLSAAPQNTALQSFNAGGPVGMLPMNDGVFSVVWSLPEDQVENWLHCDEQKFINGLNLHINRDFGRLELLSERVAFPLRKSQVSSFFDRRVVLVGDAAHTIHPLAGQGVNLGFADAMALAAKLQGVSLRQSDEVAHALKKHQRVRRAEVMKTAQLMDVLHHLFTQQQPMIKWLRATGMKGIDGLKPIKNWLLQQAGS